MKNSTPIQTDSQNLGDIGETTVQLILKKFKWTADIIKSDFGEDIDSNIFIDNSRTNYHLRCQVKSTTKDSEYVKLLKNGNYSVSIASSTLKAWLTSYFPVFLIIYEEQSDLCYWCNPIEQILKNPSKLEKEKPSIQVPKKNIFNLSSKEIILEEVKSFYRKIQRLDESIIECKIVPILMPNYRIIPFHHYSSFIFESNELSPEISGDYIELLPSWMSVLKRIDPTSILTSIKLKSNNTEIDVFLTNLKKKINSFEYSLKDNEWISFIVSPITIESNKSSWSNEITFWNSYSKLKNTLIDDYDYCFEIPNNFLRQVSRRARSWEYLHHVNPTKDVAIQLFGSFEITPTIKKIDQIHDNNIKGQLVLWSCKTEEIEQLQEILSKNELTIRIIENNKAKQLLAITTPMFDPFIGLYSVPMDWDSFEKGNVRNKLIQNKLFDLIPGKEYKGKVPEFLSEVLNKYSDKDYKSVTITESEYIAGFPLKLEEREIFVSRFQMIPNESVQEIKEKLNKSQPLNLKNYHIEFGLKDDSMWETPIYELLISWTPEIIKSSKESYIDNESKILEIFNNLMPTKEIDSLRLKNTYEILRFAGEIGFEK
ncbi:DUF4365 domain-containing protein [Wenyingzhuangia aestuarii]|uniref:DUF4365 domain-containing protein n=1 Tax=Wenyingzhuangia aestuarii TaxID=1647582 RepID=UPI00143B1FFD|nr:DUF4365 domain-containing protein [Wenyingzhuangia aestuarii]NJB83755.1 hypothetical protein [Wenyingzhuangia aestuarii]